MRVSVRLELTPRSVPKVRLVRQAVRRPGSAGLALVEIDGGPGGGLVELGATRSQLRAIGHGLIAAALHEDPNTPRRDDDQ